MTAPVIFVNLVFLFAAGTPVLKSLVALGYLSVLAPTQATYGTSSGMHFDRVETLETRKRAPSSLWTGRPFPWRCLR
jgi:hypothetical protein